jgi:hypothetical protein
MKLEDPELHKVPKPWVSEQHVMNIRAVGIFGLFSAFGIFFYYLTRSNSTEDMFAGYFITGMFFLMGFGFLAGVIYTNFDQKDHWNMWLPYNQKLYNILNKNIATMLTDKNYNHQDDTDATDKNSRTFTIKPSILSELTLNYGLEVIRGRYSTTYQFPIRIKNVRKDNLIFAHQLQKDVHEILLQAEYQGYPEEK